MAPIHLITPEVKSSPPAPAFSSVPLSLALCSVTYVMSHLYSTTEFDEYSIRPSLSGGCNTSANKLNESIRRALNQILIHAGRAAEAPQWRRSEGEGGRSYRL